jgi:hypothetical protein
MKMIAREVVMQMAEDWERNPGPPRPTRPLSAVEIVFGTILALLFVGGLIAAHFVDLPALLGALARKANEHLPFVYLWGGLAALILGGILCGVREIVGHPVYAPAELLLGSMVAGYSFGHPDFTGFVGFAGTLRIIVDGYKRIGSLRDVRAKWTGTDKGACGSN